MEFPFIIHEMYWEITGSIQHIAKDATLVHPGIHVSYIQGSITHSALARWLVASKNLFRPVIFLFTGPDWPVNILLILVLFYFDFFMISLRHY